MKIITASHFSKPSLTDDQVSRGFLIVDITIKSGCDTGWILAPTWDLVNEYRSGKISKKQYSDIYIQIITSRFDRFSQHKINTMSNTKLILVCYCPVGEFCHRYLAADFLVKRLGAIYFGEYKIS